jgi:hypothetical protein
MEQSPQSEQLISYFTNIFFNVNALFAQAQQSVTQIARCRIQRLFFFSFDSSTANGDATETYGA